MITCDPLGNRLKKKLKKKQFQASSLRTYGSFQIATGFVQLELYSKNKYK